MTAKAAAEELGVTLQTLYAYVSRGLVRSEPAPGEKRRRTYNSADIEELKRRQERSRNPEGAVENALHWGTPVMESGITLIADGRLYYRGKDAVALSRTATAEQAAALIWATDAAGFDAGDTAYLPWDLLTGLAATDAFQVATPLAAARDLSAYGLDAKTAARVGARIVGLFTVIAAGGREAAGSAADTLRRAWSVDDERAGGLLDAALILCADHELNASAFTARCVASTGATLYAAVNAGLSALQGHKHGGSTDRVEALFGEVEAVGDATRVLASYLRHGDRVPGFGHTLYPEGDPRGRALIARTRELCGESGILAHAGDLTAAAESALGLKPNVDFALVLLRRALHLPAGSALTLFALGRTVGWIGHAIEQYTTDRLIRPRARYVGTAPK
ncbi:citrate synthase [Candidatus Poribacteria bacterium]|nr:citrate synthase [Candidatus Poribacteria bacterium]